MYQSHSCNVGYSGATHTHVHAHACTHTHTHTDIQLLLVKFPELCSSHKGLSSKSSENALFWDEHFCIYSGTIVMSLSFFITGVD